MNNSEYKKIFGLLEKDDLPAGLKETIVKKVIRYEKTKRLFLSVIFFVVVVLFVIEAHTLYSIFGQSNFVYYFSLIATDLSVVLSSWKQFGLLIAESMPLFDILVFLSFAFALLWSAKNLMKSFRSGVNIKYI